MKKPVTILEIFLLIIFLFFLGQYLYYYPGSLQPFRHLPFPERPAFKEITFPPTEIKIFSDVYEKKEGNVLLDLAHSNDFTLEEFSLPILRITSRGYSFDYLESEDDLEGKLRYADALIIILPQDDFSEKELKLIKDFAKKGGKLLLIGDPTRPGEINSVATEFGLIFESDYLYNLKENDGNFRYIYLTNFKSDSELTKNLEKITLYSAGSISPFEWGIVRTDENTFSSVAEAKKNFSPVLFSPDSKVLAISDLTFVIEPYNLSTNNNQFISNLADWLTKSERTFYLSDFPYFFGDKVQLTYADASYIDTGLKLKNFLADLEKSSKLSQYEKTISGDLIFLGLFDDAPKVKDFLKEGKTTIDGKVAIEGIGKIDKKDTSILYLNKESNALILLSDTKENLEKSIDKLISGEFRNWLVTDTLAIYQKETKEAEE